MTKPKKLTKKEEEQNDVRRDYAGWLTLREHDRCSFVNWLLLKHGSWSQAKAARYEDWILEETKKEN